MKKKNLWYYKYRTKGCKFNKSAKDMQSRFIELLNQYTIKETAIPVLQAKLESIYYQQRKGDAEMTDTLQQQLTAVNKKIENIEYSYYVDRDMTREIFEKFLYKFNAERAEIKTQITG